MVKANAELGVEFVIPAFMALPNCRMYTEYQNTKCDIETDMARKYNYSNGMLYADEKWWRSE